MASTQTINVQDYCRGGSAVAGPDGRWLVEPVEGEERLVVADLELGRVAQERQNFDPPATTAALTSSLCRSTAVARRRRSSSTDGSGRPP
jgi:nitrilase